MTSTNQISCKGWIPFLLSVSFCFLMSFNSFAQGERDKVQDMPKTSDGIGQFESPESSYDLKGEQSSKASLVQVPEAKVNNSNANTRRENSIYRQGGEKDGKKEGMSTLSFNLFLYIVDKFKED